MKKFLYLYPIPEYTDFEIENHVFSRDDLDTDELIRKFEEAQSNQEKESVRQQLLQARARHFRKIYRDKLNACIDTRYRQNGFAVYYALFDNHELSDVVHLLPTDCVLYVGMDYTMHTTKRLDGTYPYPDPDILLDQIGPAEHLRIAGFHMWSCIEKVAKRSHERGIDTLVDEDLTNWFTYRMCEPEFQLGSYPSIRPCGDDEAFLEARKGKPWYWQDY